MAVVAVALTVAGCAGGTSASETGSSAPEPSPGTEVTDQQTESGAPAAAAPYEWQRVEPSTLCLEGMRTTAEERDFEAADVLIVETLSACSSAAEWLSALEREPGALGLTERAEIGLLDLEVVCWRNEATPVCGDAIATGAIEPAK